MPTTVFTPTGTITTTGTWSSASNAAGQPDSNTASFAVTYFPVSNTTGTLEGGTIKDSGGTDISSVIGSGDTIVKVEIGVVLTAAGNMLWTVYFNANSTDRASGGVSSPTTPSGTMYYDVTSSYSAAQWLTYLRDSTAKMRVYTTQAGQQTWYVDAILLRVEYTTGGDDNSSSSSSSSSSSADEQSESSSSSSSSSSSGDEQSQSSSSSIVNMSSSSSSSSSSSTSSSADDPEYEILDPNYTAGDWSQSGGGTPLSCIDKQTYYHSEGEPSQSSFLYISTTYDTSTVSGFVGFENATAGSSDLMFYMFAAGSATPSTLNAVKIRVSTDGGSNYGSWTTLLNDDAFDFQWLSYDITNDTGPLSQTEVSNIVVEFQYEIDTDMGGGVLQVAQTYLISGSPTPATHYGDFFLLF